MSTPGPTGPTPIHSYYRIDPSRASAKKTKGTLGSRVVTVTTTDPAISPTMIKKALETVSDQFTDETYLREVTVQKGTDKEPLTVTFTRSAGTIGKVTCTINGTAAPNHPIVRDLANFDSPNLANFESRVDHVPTSSWTQFSKSIIHFIAYGLRTILSHLPGLGYPFLSEDPIPTINLSAENTPSKLSRPPIASFLDGLRAMNMVTKGLDQSSTTALDGAIALGEGIQKVVADKTTLITFLHKLQTQLESATIEKPVILPTGSFSQGKFIPAILLIYQNEDKSTYTMKKISLAQEGTSGRAQSVNSVTFPDIKILNFFISQVIENSDLTNNAQRSLDQILETAGDTKVCTSISQVQEDIIPLETLTNPDPLGLLSACGNRVHQLEELISSLQEKLSNLEPQAQENASLIHQTKEQIRSAQNELLEHTEGSLASLANTGALHPYLSQITRVILTKIRNLSPQERMVYVAAIKNNATALKQQLTLAYGRPIADAFMTTLDQNIKRVVPFLQASSSEEYRRALTDFQKDNPEGVIITIPNEVSKQTIQDPIEAIREKKRSDPSCDVTQDLAKVRELLLREFTLDIVRNFGNRKVIINGSPLGVSPTAKKIIGSSKPSTPEYEEAIKASDSECDTQVKKIYTDLKEFYEKKFPGINEVDLEEKILGVMDQLRQGGISPLAIALTNQFKTDQFHLNKSFYELNLSINPDEISTEGSPGTLRLARKIYQEVISLNALELRPPKPPRTNLNEYGIIRYDEEPLKAEGFLFAECTSELTSGEPLNIHFGVLRIESPNRSAELTPVGPEEGPFVYEPAPSPSTSLTPSSDLRSPSSLSEDAAEPATPPIEKPLTRTGDPSIVDPVVTQPEQQASSTEPAPPPNIPNLEKSAAPAGSEADSVTSPVDHDKLAKDLEFIKTQMGSLNYWFTRSIIQGVVSTAGIKIDLSAINTALQNAKFTDDELKILLTHPNSILKELIDIYDQYKNGRLTIEDAKKQAPTIIAKLDPSIKAKSFRPYYDQLPKT